MGQRANRPVDVWKRVRIGAPNECWLWTGSTLGFGYGPNGERSRSFGYGRLSINNNLRLAHHVTYELTHGPIADGQIVLHRCDTPRCCNPAHLFAGTYRDNMLDMYAKQRANKATGARSGRANAKLAPEDVRAIRRLVEQGHPKRSVALRYNVHQETIRVIAKRITWRFVA